MYSRELLQHLQHAKTLHREARLEYVRKYDLLEHCEAAVARLVGLTQGEEPEPRRVIQVNPGDSLQQFVAVDEEVYRKQGNGL